jgi:hypothetical protein
MESSVTSNAFRVLCLAADAEMKDVYRQQRRLQNALELGDTDSLIRFKFIRPLAMGTEMLLEAVHRLERERLMEELFWVHDLGGEIILDFQDADSVLNAFRSETQLNTTRGAVAQHNLAVISTCLALECSSERAVDFWHEALSSWTKTLANPIFWDFIEDRAGAACTTKGAVRTQLQSQAQQTIQKLVNSLLWKAVTERNHKAIARLAQLAVVHAGLLDSVSTIADVANQFMKDGSAEIGSILAKVAGITKGSNPAATRASLVAAERDIKKAYENTASILRALAAKTAAAWSDAHAVALGHLSVAYFNIVGDTNESLRLVAKARQSAQDPATRKKLEQGWQYVQRALLCSEAISLIGSGDFGVAEQKLAGALALSTDEQKPEVQQLLDTCRRARVFRGVDTTKKSPILRAFNGIGAVFYGKRDFDPFTKTYITNHWFVFLLIPIIPIASYRVSTGSRDDLYHIYGRVPLSPLLKKWRWAVLAATVILIAYANIDFRTSSSAVAPAQLAGSSPTPTYSSGAPSTVHQPSIYRPPSSSSAPSTVHQPSIYRPPSSSSAPGPVHKPSIYQFPSSSQKIPNYLDIVERQAIEAERSELRQTEESLNEREKQIEKEREALDSMLSFKRSVESQYTAGNVPQAVLSQYETTISIYNSRYPEFNRTVESFKSDWRVYERRRDAFNARVNHYNANR